MTFVCSNVFSQNIQQRKERVESCLPEKQLLNELPVVTDAVNFCKALNPSKLSVCCRKLVENTKCYGNMAANKRECSQSGVKLLHRTMRHRMEEKFFLRDYPGLMDFLQHHLPKSTLERCYRSHTDLAAIHRIKVIMRRDPRTKQERTEEEKRIREEMLDDGRRKIIIPAACARRRNQVFVRLKLMAGSEMTITAPNGVMMEVESKDG